MFNGILRFLLLLSVFLSACQPVSPATLEAPTTTPTIQPAPTEPAISATPIATADFEPEALLGIWTRSDSDRGDLFLVFNENGTYFASHGSPDTIIHSGDYSLEGRLFTFMNGWDCADTPGIYILRIISDGRSLLLDPQNDKCPDRPVTLKSYRWDKVEATPAP
jgi:hypothetical protein